MRLQARRNITGSYNRNRGRVKADNDSLRQYLSRPLLRCAAEESSVESESDGLWFVVKLFIFLSYVQYFWLVFLHPRKNYMLLVFVK